MSQSARIIPNQGRKIPNRRSVNIDEPSFYGSSYPPNSHSSRHLNPAQRLPQRTTKLTQKLVLFPADEAELSRPEELKYDDMTTHSPAEDGAQSEAERLHKSDRMEVPRVTSYCVSEAFSFKEIINYLKESHGITPIQYDECLFFFYEKDKKEQMFGVPSANMFHVPLERSVSFQGSLYGNFTPEIVEQESKNEDTKLFERGEVFIFDYGVVVLWHFTELEEAAFLTHIMSFAVDPVREEDMEIEDFNFQYDIGGQFKPRIFNDLITMKSADPLIKLTISHGLSQSVKLSRFENMMEETIAGTCPFYLGAVPLPMMLAKYGAVKMDRPKITMIIGELYDLRMNVNLISNVLDTPEMFWSEPGLKGLYSAIRGYLEIAQRAALMNKRADVLADLLSMLSDHLNSSEMTYITWIIIILICVAAFVALAEVIVKVLRVQSS